MRPVQDPDIISQIERIGEYYRSNIANRFLRPALLQFPLDKMTWDQLETLTEKIDQFKYQGIHMDELYRQIAAAANFVYIARREMGPAFKNRLIDTATGADRVLRNMAINTFSSNVQVFADMINELFVSVVELDKAAAKGRKPLYTQMPEVGEIGKRLVGDQRL